MSVITAMSLRIVAAASVFSFVSVPASAFHGGLFRGAPRTAGPSKAGGASSAAPTSAAQAVSSSSAVQPSAGGGPELPFAEDHWEFWWEFHHDGFLGLRPMLEERGVGGTGGFQVVDHDFRAQVLMPTLLTSLRDRDEQVRASAAYALARTGLSETVPYLRHVLANDSSASVRSHTVLALGQVRSARATDTLQGLLTDEGATDELRAYAAIALGTSALPGASAALRDAWQVHESALPSTVRSALIYSLGLTEDPSNAPFLRGMVAQTQADERLRALVVLGLGRVGDRASQELLREALGDPSHRVRRAAAIALGIVGVADDEETRVALERRARRDSDGVVRNFADLALGRIAARGSEQAGEFLLGQLEDVSARRRGFVALAVGISRHPNAVAALTAMFRDESSHSLQAAAAVGLALAGDDECVPHLRAEYEETRDPYLRGYLAFALGKLGDDGSRETMRRALQDEHSPEALRWTTVGLACLGDSELTPALQDAAVSGSTLERTSALYALGLLGDRGQAEFLQARASASDETELGRAYATYALGMLCDRDREAIPAIYARDHDYTQDLPFVGELFFLF